MRLKRRMWLLGILLLTAACVEIVFQPIQRKPKPQSVTFTYHFEEPMASLVPSNVQFADKADDAISKLKIGFYDLHTDDKTNSLVVIAEAGYPAEARMKERLIESAIRPLGKFTLASEDLSKVGTKPIATLGSLALFHLRPHFNLGLDLQGGSHLVLQLRRARFDYKSDEPIVKSADDRLKVAREVRELLSHAGLDDCDIDIPKDTNNRIVIRTQAANHQQFRSHQQIVRRVLEDRFGSIKEARAATFYDFQADTLDRTVEIIRTRVDSLGVREPLIQKQGADRIVVEMPGIKDPQEAIATIGTTAQLEFRAIPPKYEPHSNTVNGVEQVSFAAKNGSSITNEQVFDESPIILTGNELKPNAEVGFDKFGQPTVDLEFNSVGRRKFGNFTRRNVGHYLGIFLDGKPISCPVIREPITGGKCQISGGFQNTQEANRLKVLLNAGALPIPIDIVENRTISASLGADSLRRSLVAGIWGVALVILFMAVYYRLPGLMADFALLIYCVMVMAMLVLVNATLTLPGLAGFILSIGMAVDANVIIFERLKEELRTNKTFKSALDAGFDRAFTAILDSQLTTLIAAFVLYVYGTGAIRGFAVTLSLGTIASLFTSITCTRLFMNIVADTRLAKVRSLYRS